MEAAVLCLGCGVGVEVALYPGSYHCGDRVVCFMKMLELLDGVGDICLSLSSHLHLSRSSDISSYQISCLPRRKTFEKCFSTSGQFNYLYLIQLKVAK